VHNSFRVLASDRIIRVLTSEARGACPRHYYPRFLSLPPLSDNHASQYSSTFERLAHDAENITILSTTTTIEYLQFLYFIAPCQRSESHSTSHLTITGTAMTPPRHPTQNLLSPTSGTVPSPLQVLFFSHSPTSPNLSRLTSTPAHRSSSTGPNTASNPIPSDLAARLQNILGDVQSTPDQDVEQLSELPDATRIVPAIDNSISLPDGIKSNPDPTAI
jgi:hypothetical protein